MTQRGQLQGDFSNTILTADKIPAYISVMIWFIIDFGWHNVKYFPIFLHKWKCNQDR